MLGYLIVGALLAVTMLGFYGRARRQARMLTSTEVPPPRRDFAPLPEVSKRQLAPEAAMRCFSVPEEREPPVVIGLRRVAPQVDEYLMMLEVWKAHCAVVEGEPPSWPCAEPVLEEIRERGAHGFSEVIVGGPRLVTVLAGPERIALIVEIAWLGLNEGGWQERVDRWKILSRSSGADWRVQGLHSQRYGSPCDPPPFDTFSLRHAPPRQGGVVSEDLQAAVRDAADKTRSIEGPIGATWRVIETRAAYHRVPSRGQAQLQVSAIRLLEEGPSHVTVWVEGKRLDEEGRRFAEAWTFVPTDDGWVLVDAA